MQKLRASNNTLNVSDLEFITPRSRGVWGSNSPTKAYNQSINQSANQINSLQIAAKPPVLRCHLAYTNKENDSAFYLIYLVCYNIRGRDMT